MMKNETSTLLRAGQAELEITPSMPIDLGGSMVRRLSEGVNDPLFARALVIENGETRLVFVLLDLIYLLDEDCQPLRKQIAVHLGVPVAHVCIACTHTHRGPVVRRKNSFAMERNETWFAWAMQRVVEAVDQAVAILVPAEVSWGRGQEGRPQYNRRWYLEEGTVRTNPRPPDRLSHPAGPTDPDFPVLLVRNAENSELIGVIGNYSLHYIGDGPGRKISADYFGEFSALVKSRLGSSHTVAMLTHGASGDINNINHAGLPTPWYPESPAHGERSRLIAGWLVDEVEKVFQQAVWTREAKLGALETIYPLRLRKIAEQELARNQREAEDQNLPVILRAYANARLKQTQEAGKTHPKVISSLRVGEWAATTFPGEMFCQFGLDLKWASPFPVTAFVELANGYAGYIATHFSYLLGGYETWHGGSVFAEPGSGEEMLRLAITQLQKLYQGKPPVLEPNMEQLP